MNEPKTFRAGDTVTWTEDGTTFPASKGWTMKYTISGSSTISVTGVASGDGYLISLTAAQTAGLVSGTYVLAQFVEIGSGAAIVRQTLSTTSVDVQRNLSTAYAGDARTHLQRVLESIRAVIESRATKADTQITIAGRSIAHIPLGELMKYYTQYEYWVAEEKKRDRIAKGMPIGNKVMVQFR